VSCVADALVDIFRQSPLILFLISSQQSKNSGRAVRKPENVEETGVEESVCSIDGPSGVHHQPPPQLAQSTQQQQSNPADSTDLLASEINPLPMVSASTKTVSKF
jgi:hypothetical protein